MGKILHRNKTMRYAFLNGSKELMPIYVSNVGKIILMTVI